MNTQAPRLLRFADLREAGIVTNWPQLKRLVDNGGFPPGFMLSPAIRVFPAGEVGVNGSGGPTCLTRPILRG